MTHPPTFIITELVNLRKEKLLTRVEIAALSDIEPNTLKNYELNYSDPGLRKVVA
jgi:transcriptional regulator with XRE-family HTH domain